MAPNSIGALARVGDTAMFNCAPVLLSSPDKFALVIKGTIFLGL